MDAKDWLEVGGAVVNIFVIYVMSKVKLEIAEVKIWIMENFERREHPRN